MRGIALIQSGGLSQLVGQLTRPTPLGQLERGSSPSSGRKVVDHAYHLSIPIVHLRGRRLKGKNPKLLVAQACPPAFQLVPGLHCLAFGALDVSAASIDV